MSDADFFDDGDYQSVDDTASCCSVNEEEEIQTETTDSFNGDQVEDYTILSLSAVQSQMKAIADRQSEIMNVSPATMRLLLRKFNWNCEKLLEKFTDAAGGILDVFLVETAISLDLTDALEFNTYVGECEICFCEGGLHSLRCGHPACKDCWSSFIESRISDGNVEISCIHNDCGILLNDEQVLSLATNEKVAEAYNRLLGKVFVESNHLLKWCPGADCSKVIEISSAKKGISAYCECGADLCSSCNECAHLPLSCDRFKDWKDGKMKDAESVKWISQNARPCPACKVPIEKNGGCNFMNCTNPSCLRHFCWTCMIVLTTNHQVHNCHLFDGQFENKDVADMERFNHYFKRFMLHRNSEVLEEKLRPQVASFLISKAKEGCCKSQTNTISCALMELLKCRRVLAYAYCFLFYLKEDQEESNVQKNIIENNLKDLQSATEKLSAMFEKDSTFWKATNTTIQPVVAEFMDQEKFLRIRRHLLLNHCSECVFEGYY